MMYNKIALVTGANAGMGKVIATELARQGATVVMVARDRRRGEEAMREIASTIGNASLDLLVADLSSHWHHQAIPSIARTGSAYYTLTFNVTRGGRRHWEVLRARQDGRVGYEDTRQQETESDCCDKDRSPYRTPASTQPKPEPKPEAKDEQANDEEVRDLHPALVAQAQRTSGHCPGVVVRTSGSFNQHHHHK
jgi:hypothetical protein